MKSKLPSLSFSLCPRFIWIQTCFTFHSSLIYIFHFYFILLTPVAPLLVDHFRSVSFLQFSQLYSYYFWSFNGACISMNGLFPVGPFSNFFLFFLPDRVNFWLKCHFSLYLSTKSPFACNYSLFYFNLPYIHPKSKANTTRNDTVKCWSVHMELWLRCF